MIFLAKRYSGVYIMIFLQCMQVLQRRRWRPSDYLLGTTVSLFVLITAVSKLHIRFPRSYGSQRHSKHLVIDIIRTLDAFTSNMATPNYPIEYYGNLVTWQDISRNAVYVTTTVVSDAFIVSLALAIQPLTIILTRGCPAVSYLQCMGSKLSRYYHSFHAVFGRCW